MIINAAIKLILKFISGLDWSKVVAIGKDLINMDSNQDMKGTAKFAVIMEQIISSGILGTGKSMNIIRVFVELLLYYTRKNPTHFSK